MRTYVYLTETKGVRFDNADEKTAWEFNPQTMFIGGSDSDGYRPPIDLRGIHHESHEQYVAKQVEHMLQSNRINFVTEAKNPSLSDFLYGIQWATERKAVRESQYNGWANYPTWNVPLWIDNEESVQYAVNDYIKWNGSYGLQEMIEEMFFSEAEECLGTFLCRRHLWLGNWSYRLGRNSGSAY